MMDLLFFDVFFTGMALEKKTILQYTISDSRFMQVIFITRKYPPARGGMETFSKELADRFPGESQVLHNGRRHVDIVWAAPLLLFRAVLRKRRASLYHLGDLVLAPLAPLLRYLTGKPIIATVHALELVYKSSLLRELITRSLSSIDHFVAVSEYTKDLLVQRGVADSRITVIPHGVTVQPSRARDEARAEVERLLNLPPDRPILLTVGRLVPRKGVSWFVANVLPRLRDLHPLYLVVSTGPDQCAIEEAREKHQLHDSVRLLGKVSDLLLTALYQGSDLFVMPNVSLPDDAEGFGFVAIEAAAAGLPVVASRTDGIPSSVHDSNNGLLVEPENADAYERVIRSWLEDDQGRREFGRRAAAYTKEHFNWDAIVEQYNTLFQKYI